jgi:hypothetical protein
MTTGAFLQEVGFKTPNWTLLHHFPLKHQTDQFSDCSHIAAVRKYIWALVCNMYNIMCLYILRFCPYIWFISSNRVLHVFNEVQKRRKPSNGYNPDSLLFLSATALVSSNVNFFEPGLLPNTLQEYLADIYPKFSVCDNCHKAVPYSSSGKLILTHSAIGWRE